MAVRLVKQLVVRRHFRRCDAFITVGDNNEAYYKHYGVTAAKMFRGAYPVDVSRFRTALALPDRPSRGQVRQRFGLPADGLVVISSGKLQPIKRPHDLVEAVAILRRQGVPLYALFVGDGPLRPSLEQRIRDLELDENRREQRIRPRVARDRLRLEQFVEPLAGQACQVLDCRVASSNGTASRGHNA